MIHFATQVFHRNKLLVLSQKKKESPPNCIGRSSIFFLRARSTNPGSIELAKQKTGASLKAAVGQKHV
jgi:hypothetical protein